MYRVYRVYRRGLAARSARSVARTNLPGTCQCARVPPACRSTRARVCVWPRAVAACDVGCVHVVVRLREKLRAPCGRRNPLCGPSLTCHQWMAHRTREHGSVAWSYIVRATSACNQTHSRLGFLRPEATTTAAGEGTRNARGVAGCTHSLLSGAHGASVEEAPAARGLLGPRGPPSGRNGQYFAASSGTEARRGIPPTSAVREQRTR